MPQVVLHLLRQDSAAMRAIAITAFKAVATETSPRVLEHLLRVLDGSGHLNAGSEAEEEEEYEGGGSRSSSSSSQEEEEEDDDEDEDVDEEGGSKAAAAVKELADGEGRGNSSVGEAGAAGGGGALDSGVYRVLEDEHGRQTDNTLDLSQAASEELDALDERVAAALRMKRSPAQRFYQEHHTRVRLIELLEIWAWAHPTDYLRHLEIMRVLMALLPQLAKRDAKVPDAGLQLKIMASVAKRLPPPPPLSYHHAAADASDLEACAADFAGSMLNLTREAPSLSIAETAGRSLVFALRCLPPEGARAHALANRTRVLLLETLTTRKARAVRPAVFLILTSRLPGFMGRMLPDIVGCCSAARSQYRQVDAVELLHSMLSHLQVTGSAGSSSLAAAVQLRAAAEVLGKSMQDLLRSFTQLLGAERKRAKSISRCLVLLSRTVAKLSQGGNSAAWQPAHAALVAHVKSLERLKEQSGGGSQGRVLELLRGVEKD
jgi:hypothetical protein